MIKTLLSINADLASSIALRYACQLAKMTGMLLLPMHVVEPEQEGHSPGTGWVRRTWEKGLLETAQAEISRLMNAERGACPTLGPPRISIGVRDDVLLRELEGESYDLFVEGILHSFDSSYFQKRLRSRLYREMPCSTLLVKNLVNLKNVALLLEDEPVSGDMISSFIGIVEGAEMEVDLFRCRFQTGGRLNFEDNEKAPPSSLPKEPDNLLGSAEKTLAEKGRTVRESMVVQGTPVKIAQHLEDYSLVATFLPRQKAVKGPLLDLLARVPSAVLLCRE